MRYRLPENFEKTIIALLLAAAVFCMLAAALCRHLWPEMGDVPLHAAAGCLAWMAAVGMARAAHLGTHVRVTAVESVVGERGRARLNLLADVLFLLFAALAFAVGAAVLVEAINHPSPRSPAFICLAIPVGSVLTAVRLIERIRGHFHRV